MRGPTPQGLRRFVKVRGLAPKRLEPAHSQAPRSHLGPRLAPAPGCRPPERTTPTKVGASRQGERAERAGMTSSSGLIASLTPDLREQSARNSRHPLQAASGSRSSQSPGRLAPLKMCQRGCCSARSVSVFPEWKSLNQGILHESPVSRRPYFSFVSFHA
jgi:hypothetical protein